MPDLPRWPEYYRFKTMSEVQAAGAKMVQLLATKLSLEELQILEELVDANGINQDFELDLHEEIERRRSAAK